MLSISSSRSSEPVPPDDWRSHPLSSGGDCFSLKDACFEGSAMTSQWFACNDSDGHVARPSAFTSCTKIAMRSGWVCLVHDAPGKLQLQRQELHLVVRVCLDRPARTF
jgi:hypothetical protein